MDKKILKLELKTQTISILNSSKIKGGKLSPGSDVHISGDETCESECVCLA